MRRVLAGGGTLSTEPGCLPALLAFLLPLLPLPPCNEGGAVRTTEEGAEGTELAFGA